MPVVRVGRRKNDGREPPNELHPMEPRDAYFRLRMTAGELTAWKLAARQSGRSVSELVRLVMRQTMNGGREA